MPLFSTRSLTISLNLSCACLLAQAQQDAPTPVPPVALIKGYLCDGSDYPAAARRSEAQGTVRIGFTAEPDGKIGEVVIIKSSGNTREHKLLDLVAKRQVQSCKLVDPTPRLEPRRHEIELVWKLR